jgi:hypothetical protein
MSGCRTGGCHGEGVRCYPPGSACQPGPWGRQPWLALPGYIHLPAGLCTAPCQLSTPWQLGLPVIDDSPRPTAAQYLLLQAAAGLQGQAN